MADDNAFFVVFGRKIPSTPFSSTLIYYDHRLSLLLCFQVAVRYAHSMHHRMDMMKQQKLSITLALITVGIFIVWGYQMTTTAMASLSWEIYDISLYLSGLLSIGLM